MVVIAMLLLALALLVDFIAGTAIPGRCLNDALSPLNSSRLARRGDIDNDPTNMAWIKKWAAVGDSFTAGIGAGRAEDKKCSRYDLSYVRLLDRAFGAQVQYFKYLACSGAKTGGVIKQIQKLDNDLDLVVMTAGGNDLCLIDVLKACVFLPYFGEKKCDEAIEKAKVNLEYILRPNVKALLKELEHHVRFNGVVLYGGYAQFFHDGNENTGDCSRQQDWTFPRFGQVFEPLKLTLERRRKCNDLVVRANEAIQKTIEENKRDGFRYRLRYVDWDNWASDTRVAGQFCWPNTDGQYPDPNQPQIQFFKPDTKKRGRHDEVKKRDAAGDMGYSEPAPEDIEASVSKDLYNSALYRSENPSAVALHRLDGRGVIEPANCPGANDRISFGFGLPDRWGKFFHPNLNGHVTIASFFLNELIAAQASLMSKVNPICRDGDNDHFDCNVNVRELVRHYASAHLVDESYKTYCEEVKQPPNLVNWHDERVFHEGTPEEHRYSVTLEHGAFQYSKKQCLESFLRLIHGCGTTRDDNPLNMKHGGTWKKGRYTYKLSMGRRKRPWPVARPSGSCYGGRRVLSGSYVVRGALWGNLDFGRALHDSAKDCIGGGLTSWKFRYFHKSDANGMEWEATFNTPVWVLWRCFQNNKVFERTEAPHIGCEGNDHPP
ncbi:hypothetical protein BBP40_012525 [Aspergillus hancockii]|nr:hypothetical protein BBP40_012525 [Aspergillus hancockii]